LAYILIFSLAWLSYGYRPACQAAFECHYMCCPGFVTYKKKINRQHRHRFADIETITIYQNFDIFLDDIDTIRYGQYRLDISFGRYRCITNVNHHI